VHWSRKRAVKRLWWWWFHALHGATNRVSTDKMVICFWATICKTVHHCLSVLSVALVYCGQTIGWIRMPLIMEVDLGPGHIVLDGDPASAKRGTAPPPTFRPTAVAGLPISATAELLLHYCFTLPAYLPACMVVRYLLWFMFAAELGDYSPDEHTPGYLSVFRFIPHQSEDFEQTVSEHHRHHV